VDCVTPYIVLMCYIVIVSTCHYLSLYVFADAGIKNSSSVDQNRSLAHIGIDSLINVEIQQTLQRDYDISLSAEEIRALTFAKLDQMSISTPQSSAINQAPAAFDVRDLFLPTEPVVEMNHVDTGACPLFVIHPVEGSVFSLRSLMSKVQSAKVYGIQCTSDTPLTSVPDLASHYIKVAFIIFVSFLYKITQRIYLGGYLSL